MGSKISRTRITTHVLPEYGAAFTQALLSTNIALLYARAQSPPVSQCGGRTPGIVLLKPSSRSRLLTGPRDGFDSVTRLIAQGDP
ncbi:hypothetical protein LshimejAT787_0505860 [Lyophyllum shimeji]|uniref:Uncharacterized protein n=1 Tax=Lyophyllum shimeji TaxID=47721 RepID=A0A9P3PN62_LYOSH|nr:hypothetical protein LshimejAT787_0505860 [Lyophyllum shimeji]